jgi:disulfide bond formation protein DsbB
LTDVVATMLALLAVVVQVVLVSFLLVLVLSLVWAPARRARDALRGALDGAELALAWAVALAATAGSLYFSEVAHFAPCQLCWFQRIAMYPLVLILLLAALWRDRRGAAYAVGLPLLGGAISVYHLWIEHHPESAIPGCGIGVPCSVRWIEELGYVTIPVLALTAFAAVAALLALALRPLRHG